MQISRRARQTPQRDVSMLPPRALLSLLLAQLWASILLLPTRAVSAASAGWQSGSTAYYGGPGVRSHLE